MKDSLVMFLQIGLFFGSWGLPIWIGNWWPTQFPDRYPIGEEFLALPSSRQQEINQIRQAEYTAYSRSGQTVGLILELVVWAFVIWGIPRIFY